MSKDNMVIGIPSEEHRACPNCKASAAVIDVGVTACCGCGSTIRVKPV